MSPEFLVLHWAHDPTSQLLDQEWLCGALGACVSLPPLGLPLHPLVRMIHSPQLPTPLITFLGYLHVSVFHNTTSQKVGCGSMCLT